MALAPVDLHGAGHRLPALAAPDTPGAASQELSITVIQERKLSVTGKETPQAADTGTPIATTPVRPHAIAGVRMGSSPSGLLLVPLAQTTGGAVAFPTAVTSRRVYQSPGGGDCIKTILKDSKIR